MEWLNYHHLLYFYTVAREGSVTEAAKKLRLAQPTLSGQIRTLEETLDEKLFIREGRRLVLSEAGQLVYRYAEEIFSTGEELLDALRGRPTSRPAKLLVGVADVVPKLISYRLLQTALQLSEPVQLVLYEGKANELISGLGTQRYDMVLTDMPLNPQSVRVRAYNHPLGSTGVSFFAEPKLARRLRRNFPASLDGAPMLLPTPSASLRHALDRWFESLDIKPDIVAEIEDTALMKVFGQHGTGVFAAPTVVADDVCKSHSVAVLGKSEDVREHFFVITVERRIAHPAVAAIAEAARNGMLA